MSAQIHAAPVSGSGADSLSEGPVPVSGLGRGGNPEPPRASPDQADLGIRTTISISRKVNLGNYESADVFVSVNNIPAGATAEDIEAALDTGRIAYDILRDEINRKARDLRGKGRE